MNDDKGIHGPDEPYALKWADERVEWMEKQWDIKGTNLSNGQKAFLTETFKRDIMWTTGDIGTLRSHKVEFPVAMTSQQRQRKQEVRDKLRSALTDLSMMAEMTRPQYRPEDHAPWFDMDDARYVLDFYQLRTLVSYCVEVFGDQFVNEVLNTMTGFYDRRNERIVIQRELSHGLWSR